MRIPEIFRMHHCDHISLHCPLCAADGAAHFHRDNRRDYFRCGACHLVFVSPQYFLSAAEEKACYDRHQNNPEDADYRRFLSRLFEPLVVKLSPGDRGLDFGCGPGPTLSVMLAEAGHSTAIYDPFYEPNTSVWHEEYDFVVASEVVEHLHFPMADLQRVWQVLKPGGWLGIMTKRVVDLATFEGWHYKKDPTHVCFFSESTFAWLATEWQAALEIVGPDVVLMQKPANSGGA